MKKFLALLFILIAWPVFAQQTPPPTNQNQGVRALLAHLSDGSAPDYVNTAFSGSGQYDAVYTITYSATSAGQQLVVTWTQGSGSGNVTLQGTALQ